MRGEIEVPQFVKVYLGSVVWYSDSYVGVEQCINYFDVKAI